MKILSLSCEGGYAIDVEGKRCADANVLIDKFEVAGIVADPETFMTILMLFVPDDFEEVDIEWFDIENMEET